MQSTVSVLVIWLLLLSSALACALAWAEFALSFFWTTFWSKPQRSIVLPLAVVKVKDVFFGVSVVVVLLFELDFYP